MVLGPSATAVDSCKLTWPSLYCSRMTLSQTLFNISSLKFPKNSCTSSVNHTHGAIKGSRKENFVAKKAHYCT
eukprot:6223762-Amphidinium_carterae.1